ncbi:hypothetical protein M5K25_027221 [Dendrobium thyrsiflorum]|uniref:Uncharacterized protein n=1 Tax=Dendrobium thyrsiflorum TaxID=117978 RepID=A0ABD0TZG0_DENTH
MKQAGGSPHSTLVGGRREEEAGRGRSSFGFHRRAAVVEDLQVVVGAPLLLLITRSTTTSGKQIRLLAEGARALQHRTYLTFHYAMSQISIRLLIDKEQKRVLYAEAGSDFIDVLFSFLALPLGSIVRLLGKQTSLGSLDNLYESVEQLEVKYLYLQTEACKEMLLKPRSAAADICEDLKITNIHDVNPRHFYICNEIDCLQSSSYYTHVTKARCSHCGKLMDKNWNWPKATIEKRGVMPISLMSGFSLFEKLRINDASILEKRDINVGNEEALNLLRISLVSKRALTRLFFPDECIEQSVKCFSMIKEEIDDGEEEQQMNVKIIFNKKNNNVLYAEVDGYFVNQMLSFLTFPLGSVFMLLGDQISLEGCISNLYSSAEKLNLECFQSEKCKNMLVLPEIASHYGYDAQMLQLDEKTSTNVNFSSSCVTCYLDYGPKSHLTSPCMCMNGLTEVNFIEQNPKLEYGVSYSGGGFVECNIRFMVADNLQISPISSISAITEGTDFLISDLVEKEVSVDKAKVLSLLGATLISKTVLTDARAIKMHHRRDLTSNYAMPEISIKLVINKEQKQVVFAEAGSDFIDVLFSFLTLPLGSIVQLLGKQSGLGSLDSLYKSVEELDVKHLQTEACKEMLLKPRSAAARLCEDLKIKNIHEDNPRGFYICKESDCLHKFPCYYTYVTKARCSRCGKLMDKDWSWPKGTVEKRGVFVNDGVDFIITDDLRVMPISLMSGFSVLEELRINDAGILEERVINVGDEEALNLLRRSLESKHALTEVFFPDACVEPSVKCFPVIKEEIDGSKAEQKFNVKIILNKKNNSVLSAEVGGDFLNQLLSFLAFPLGSVIGLLRDHISLECCINNLYYSAKSLGLECFKSKECKNMLVLPQLASHYGCKQQMLKLVEMTSTKWTCLASCIKCYMDGWKCSSSNPCKHGLREAEFTEQNPKLQNGGSESGEGFVKDSKRFMVVDSLHISPISSISLITAKGIDFLISDVVEKEIIVDKAKVLSLLGAMLISKTVLTDVFAPKQKQRSN